MPTNRTNENDGLLLFVVKAKKKSKNYRRNNAFICNECVELAQELSERN